jgi:hypothetical protein
MDGGAGTPKTALMPRYRKPKILAVDLPPSLVERLSNAGYNAVAGTFGRPYRVPMVDGFAPVLAKASLPNFSERGIVIID